MKFRRLNMGMYIGMWLILVIFTTEYALGTHLRAGQITAKRENPADCNSTVYLITVEVYTNTGSSVKFGGIPGEEDILDFGDGTFMLIPEQENISRPDLGSNIGTAYYTVRHEFSGPGRYIISYREPNRNEGVLNMDNSVNTRFYIETEIVIDPAIGCDNSPELRIAPIDQACSGVAFFHNPGAYDPDGDSLSYELVIPFSDTDQTVIRYQDPSANSPRQWYTDYANAQEDGTGQPVFSINPIDGTLLWDAPGDRGIGEYNIAFVVRQWRKRNGRWIDMGFVRRDMQIIVNDCENERPTLEIPEDICVEAGTVIEEVIRGFDPENLNVKIEAFSEVFQLVGNPATFTPDPAVYQASPAETEFRWITDCQDVREQPYQVVFKITDTSPTPNGPRLVTFETWRIWVVGPAPVWTEAEENQADESVSLTWEPYICENAETIQVWRRVDSFDYTPDNCETGMLPGLGYTQIATVPATATTYLDNDDGAGLVAGAKYCYRLVALFPSPRFGESYMSEEICVDILADAPIITNVTVDVTDETNGEITVQWLAPLDNVPPGADLQYRVYRGSGFTGAPEPTPVYEGPALQFVDEGLNTRDLVYNYTVLGLTNGSPEDTSAQASAVRLEARSRIRQIELTWSAVVPWSNQSLDNPIHDLYRGPENGPPEAFVKIADVDVTQNGFVYVDEGTEAEPLRDDQTYCYRVLTRGTFNSDRIDHTDPSYDPRLFENFSQVICAQPSDSIPPCQVALPTVLNAPDCSSEDYNELCNRNIFSNQIDWEAPVAGECQSDIAYYNVYVTSKIGGEYVLIATQVQDTYFEDRNLPSQARCYKVAAVDRSGNEGPLSEELCIDNCPYYELPNIFTPNGDRCNDFFAPFNTRILVGESEGDRPACWTLDTDTRKRCARFVNKVSIKIYNRWGKEVFEYESGGERTIYIDWDGRDNEGGELSTGIYYYAADVEFNSVDPAKRNQTIKGWVHLLR